MSKTVKRKRLYKEEVFIMRRQVLSLLVENNPGVTSHISGLFSRRGYNIDSFNSGYDFNAKEITQTAFNITRDLHCFSMTAAISPFGRWKYYNFTIRANASILQDLKWEQRSQTQSNIQWY